MYLQQDPVSHKLETSLGGDASGVVTDLIGHLAAFAAGLAP